MPDKVYSKIDGKFVEIGHENGESPLREKLVDSLEDMETCLRVGEVETKSLKDTWVVQRALVRCMWLVLTWILRRDK